MACREVKRALSKIIPAAQRQVTPASVSSDLDTKLSTRTRKAQGALLQNEMKT